jgi:anti-anti-sigma factor
MEIVATEIGAATARVALSGRLDIAGAEVIALPMATLAGAKQNLIIDMSGVTFIASIGIRHLVSAAKTVARRSGRLVLLSPNTAVVEVLTSSGLSNLLPIVHSEADAMAGLAASPRD